MRNYDMLKLVNQHVKVWCGTQCYSRDINPPLVFCYQHKMFRHQKYKLKLTALSLPCVKSDWQPSTKFAAQPAEEIRLIIHRHRRTFQINRE